MLVVEPFIRSEPHIHSLLIHTMIPPPPQKQAMGARAPARRSFYHQETIGADGTLTIQRDEKRGIDQPTSRSHVTSWEKEMEAFWTNELKKREWSWKEGRGLEVGAC